MDKLPLYTRQQVEQGISILSRGGIIAFPTDTVYGLGACSDLPGAVERIYQVKERPRNMPLPLLLADMSQINELAYSVPQVAWLLASEFLPGALTMVLRKSESVPDFISAGGTTVAVRVPAHPVPVALAQGLGVPVIGTSANMSGKPNSLTAGEVYSQFGEELDLIIDGGLCPGGKESTIVDLTGELPEVLREGAISREEPRRACPNIRFKGDS